MSASGQEYSPIGPWLTIIACGAYAAFNLVFYELSARSLLGPTSPMSFVALAAVSALSSMAVLIGCLVQRRVWTGLVASSILAAVTVLNLYAAHECSAAI